MRDDSELWPECAVCKVRYDPDTLHHVDPVQDDHWPDVSPGVMAVAGDQ